MQPVGFSADKLIQKSPDMPGTIPRQPIETEKTQTKARVLHFHKTPDILRKFQRNPSAFQPPATAKNSRA
jgi:hypothetical protein